MGGSLGGLHRETRYRGAERPARSSERGPFGNSPWLPKLGVRANIGGARARARAKFVGESILRVRVARCPPNFGRFRPNSAGVVQVWPVSSTFGRCHAKLAEFDTCGPLSATSGHRRPKWRVPEKTRATTSTTSTGFVHPVASSGQGSATFDHTWQSCTRLGRF